MCLKIETKSNNVLVSFYLGEKEYFAGTKRFQVIKAESDPDLCILRSIYFSTRYNITQAKGIGLKVTAEQKEQPLLFSSKVIKLNPHYPIVNRNLVVEQTFESKIKLGMHIAKVPSAYYIQFLEDFPPVQVFPVFFEEKSMQLADNESVVVSEFFLFSPENLEKFCDTLYDGKTYSRRALEKYTEIYHKIEKGTI